MTMKFCFATKTEKAQSLPGDELVDAPTIASTHAVTIKSPVEKVWPWLVQIGQDRGGFYSYTLLENLLGCQMKNASQINPAWQSLSEGDAVQLHPKFPPMQVEKIKNESHLVLWQQPRFDWVWAFVLIRVSQNETRLLVRTRISSDRWIVNVLLYPVMTLGHYMMERKMLLGIKRRSETD